MPLRVAPPEQGGVGDVEHGAGDHRDPAGGARRDGERDPDVAHPQHAEVGAFQNPLLDGKFVVDVAGAGLTPAQLRNK